MLDIYAPSFVFEDGIFAALVPQHSCMNAGDYLRGQYLSRSSSSTFIYICHCSSSRTESFLFSLLDLDIQTSLSSFILEGRMLPSLVLQEFLHLCHRPSSSTALSSGLVPRLRHVCYVHTRGLNFPCPGFSTYSYVQRSSLRTGSFLPWLFNLTESDFRSLLLVLHLIKHWFATCVHHHSRASQAIAGSAIQDPNGIIPCWISVYGTRKSKLPRRQPILSRHTARQRERGATS